MKLKTNNYYDRQVQLWGEEKQRKLFQKSVVIIGCGGLGNSLSLALSGIGLKEIHLVDFDKVETHNIHRQVCFNIEDETKYKAQVLSQKLSSRNIETKFINYNISFEEFIQKEIQFDLIIDATDSLIVREQINKYSKQINIPWIYSSVEEFHGQVCFFEKASFQDFNIKKNSSKGIAAPMVMQIASLSANLIIRYLLNLDIKKDLLHYMYYDSFGELKLDKYQL
ncbi:MAG: Sulfur carrier protein adenylyltransferase ThiF [uncultured Campylobacterales bacterium]|uniref:Sulfur carrier protein adenylyltransferase ThiF n=1 Tax=uncultured Campylobacterales bacterium TaxID=352960 RepID=A0A6S6SAD6_9BACT|nr:MAG: Sulfur carrier protein adenylyltransferase ThiF [uncultured Campylobacterales bacterium]